MDGSNKCHDSSVTSSASTLPTLPSSPCARAFFAALDKTFKDDTDGKQSRKVKSALIQKRIQTLGWRNRYSQAEEYPVEIAYHDNQGILRRYCFSVLQRQRGEVENTYGTGATVWPASIVLIKYMERHNYLIRNKTVVDLGSGTGVTSLAAACLGAAAVICTDGEESVVELARENIRRVVNQCKINDQIEDNTQQMEKTHTGHSRASSHSSTAEIDSHRVTTHLLQSCPIYVQQYWWGTGSLYGVSKDSNFDDNLLVIVSDCLLPKLYPIAPLVSALNQLLKFPNDDARDQLAILSYEHRYYPDYDPRVKFRELCTQCGLQVITIHESELDPVYSVDDIELWLIQRQN